ncbi:MAG: DivIVA domain-containing protein [Bacteroidota bacterium]
MITPIEIRQQKFKRALRGYDKEEVDAFLVALSKEWEQQLEDFRKLKEELEKIQNNYNTLKEVEDILHKTLMQAEQSSKDTMENARQKADLRLREAEARAQEIVRKGVEDRNEIQREISELSRYRTKFLSQLQGFLRTQMDHVNTFEQGELEAKEEELRLPEKAESTKNFFDTTRSENGTSSSNLVDDITDEL